MNTSMKPTARHPSRSTDELWMWAEQSRAAALAAKYPDLMTSRTPGAATPRHASRMTQGILNRFYALFRSPARARR